MRAGRERGESKLRCRFKSIYEELERIKSLESKV